MVTKTCECVLPLPINIGSISTCEDANMLKQYIVTYKVAKNKLNVCQRAMELSMFGVGRTDRIWNTVLRFKTCIVYIGAILPG